MLADQIQTDLTAAMKARDELKLSVLRMALAAIKEAKVSGDEVRDLTDDDVIALLAKEAKRRDEAAEAFAAGGRDESAARELAERDVLAAYLPAPVSDEEIEALVDEALTEGGFDSPAQMGLAMKAAMAKVGGKADGKKVSALVKARLAGQLTAVRALGVDAAGRHGWVGVVVDDGGFVAAHLALRLADLIADADAAAPDVDPVAVVGVDIPIGLIDGPRRAADAASRAFVGIRRSSVFWAPHRSAAAFTSQAEANEHLRAIGMPMLSAQAFGLMARIRETAEVAQVDDRLVEAFPEASFRQLAGADLPHAKKSAAGTLQRLALLAAADPPLALPTDLGAAARVPMDDLFDAAAAGWSAHRHAHGRAIPLGDPAELDPHTGRPILVWV